MIALPHMLAAGALATLIAGGAGYFIGRSDGRDIEVAAQHRADMAAAREHSAAEQRIREVEEHHAEQEQARLGGVREIIREIPRIIDRPVYRNVCIDADGVRLLDRAVAVANGQDQPGTPTAASAVPGAAANAQGGD